jgi:hypothetical protein
MQEREYVITFDVWATTDRFDPKHIKKNNRTTWRCPVTLLAENHHEQLDKLGHIRAYISPADVFGPEGATADTEKKIETFEASIWQEHNMFHTEVVHKEKRLEFQYFPAHIQMPKSEFESERDQRQVLREELKGAREALKRKQVEAPAANDAKKPPQPTPKYSQNQYRRPAPPTPVVSPRGLSAKRHYPSSLLYTGSSRIPPRRPVPSFIELQQLQRRLPRRQDLQIPLTPSSVTSSQRRV